MSNTQVGFVQSHIKQANAHARTRIRTQAHMYDKTAEHVSPIVPTESPLALPVLLPHSSRQSRLAIRTRFLRSS